MCFLVGNLSPNSRYLPGLEMPPMCSSEKTSPRRRFTKTMVTTQMCGNFRGAGWTTPSTIDNVLVWSFLSFFVRFVIQNDHDFSSWSWHCWCCRQPSPVPGPNRTPKCRGTERTCRDCSCGQAPDRGVANHILNDNGEPILWGSTGMGHLLKWCIDLSCDWEFSKIYRGGIRGVINVYILKYWRWVFIWIFFLW